MTHKTTKRKSQQGFVSIFTLMFFIILASVFTVGFMRIVLDEAQQAIYNSATNSALAAARAGIEDGKRAIILYKALVDGTATDPGGLKNALENAFSSNECNSLYGKQIIRDALGLNEFGKVETANLDEQAYTCLTAKGNTDTYETQASPSTSAIVPLTGVNSFNTIVVRWHKIDSGGLDPLASVTSPTNPPAGAFPELPTFMRLQLIRVPDNPTIGSIESYTGFLRTTFASVGNPTPSTYFMKDLEYTGVPNAPGTAGCFLSGQYSCEVQISFSSWVSGPPALGSYFLRLTPLYKQTDIQVQMQNGSGATVPFAMVQPEIDATGKSGDTLRRLKARVKFASDVNLPEYVVESIDPDPTEGTICKSFTVTTTPGVSDVHSDCPLP